MSADGQLRYWLIGLVSAGIVPYLLRGVLLAVPVPAAAILARFGLKRYLEGSPYGGAGGTGRGGPEAAV
jgi:hypothetical protein